MSVDLSKLPAPALIPAMTFEDILAAMQADAIARATAISAELGVQVTNALGLESDPANIVMQACAYRELNLRAQVNAAGEQCMLAFATGPNLDQLAANLGVTRLTGETDDALRARAAAAPDAWSVAGPEAAYEELARSADPTVADVAATSPSPGVVQVVVLSTDADGVADAQLLANVTAALSPTDVRPLTDDVEVISATISSYDVTATLYIASGLDTATVQAAALTALQAYAASRRLLNNGVAVAGVTAALMAPGVENLVLASPAADIPALATAAPVMGAVTLNVIVGGDGV